MWRKPEDLSFLSWGAKPLPAGFALLLPLLFTVLGCERELPQCHHPPEPQTVSDSFLSFKISEGISNGPESVPGVSRGLCILESMHHSLYFILCLPRSPCTLMPSPTCPPLKTVQTANAKLMWAQTATADSSGALFIDRNECVWSGSAWQWWRETLSFHFITEAEGECVFLRLSRAADLSARITCHPLPTTDCVEEYEH